MIIFNILIIILIFVLFYFSMLGIYTLSSTFITYPKSRNKKKFSILIPARNEEKVIENCIKSLNKLNYPKSRYEINVVINNCTDSTAEIAEKTNANIIYCKKDIRTKGEALSEAFEKFKDRRDIDAYTVFDSDNVVDRNFLSKINDAMNYGYEIVQGRRSGKNSKYNLVTKIYELFYMMQNAFFNTNSNRQKANASLNGTGWAISKNWIDQHGYQMKTIVEDLELTAQAAIFNTKIGYVNEAITYDEYPDSMKKIMNQLPRWVYGQVECMRIYSKLLFKKINNKSCRLMWVIFCFPAAIVPIIFLVIYSIVTVFSSEGPEFIYMLIKLIVAVYALCLALEMVEIYKFNEKISVYASSMIVFPFFLLLWVPIAIGSIFRRKCTWKHMEHDYAIEIEDIQCNL